MIESTLGYIEQSLNKQLVSRFGLNQSVVRLNRLTTLGGELPDDNQNKMVLSMVNLFHETDRRDPGMHRSADGQIVRDANPAQLYSVDLLFTANFDDYRQALKYLSATISFFQANSIFNASTHPDMPRGVSMLRFEIEDTSYLDMHNLWSAMRASYQPSIIYRVRQITIETLAVVEEVTSNPIGIFTDVSS